MLWTMLFLAEGSAEAEEGAAPTEMVLQDEPGDSLVVQEGRRPFDIENRGLRVLAKLGTGTVSGVAFTTIGFVGSGIGGQSEGDPDADAYRVLGQLLFGAFIGINVGFPLGVSAVDPYDSSLKTLLAGVTPGAVGIGLSPFVDGWGLGVATLIGYVGPVISSIYASELSRNPPQVRRVSFELAPAAKSGLYGSVRLHF